MKNLFICSTQYHLFNIMNIINSKFRDDRNELIILDCIRGLSDKLSKIALRSTYFAKVHVAKTGAINNTYKGYFQAAFRMLFPQSMLGKNNYEKIDRIFISGTEIYSRIIASYLIAYIPEIKLFYYEDGVESYSDIVGNQRHMFKGSNKILNKIYGFFLIEKCQGLYVYQPSYILSNMHNVPILKIDPIKRNTALCDDLYELFAVDKQRYNIDKKIIYFDTMFFEKEEIEQNRYLLKILKGLCAKKLILKPHPSGRTIEKIKGVENWITSDSFEISCLKEKTEDSILISVFSTACILPKMIFNDEPKVVLLYRLFNKYSSEWKLLDNFFESVKESYKDPTNFVIVQNENELINTIQKWKCY